MRTLILGLALAAGCVGTAPVFAMGEGKSAGTPSAAPSEAKPGLFVKQGETWFFKVVEGQPADVRAGDAEEKPRDGEIKVTLQGGRMTVLNGSDTPYNYQAFLARNPSDKGERTSVCTLIPGAMMNEIWPGAVPGIRLTNFKDAGDGMICA